MNKSLLYKGMFLLTILLAVLLSTSCAQKHAVQNAATNPLYGKWKWLKSSGGFAGETLTPATEHYEKLVEYLQSGICKTYKNGKIESEKKFVLKEGKSIFSEKPQPLIEYADEKKQSYSFSGNDTLYIKEECMDCFSHTYVRIK